jgi:hypothetical protein
MNSISYEQSGIALLEDLLNDGSNINNRDGMSSPSANVKDELVQQFYRLELQTMAVFDRRPPSTHWFLRDEGAESIRTMPEEFTSVEQARLHLSLIMRRIYHFMTRRNIRPSSTYKMALAHLTLRL